MQLGYSRSFYTEQGYSIAQATRLVAADQAGLPHPDVGAPGNTEFTASSNPVNWGPIIDFSPTGDPIRAPDPVHWAGTYWAYNDGTFVVPQPAVPQAVDNTTAANIGMAAVGGFVFASAGMADAGVSGADLAAPTMDASPLTAPGATDIPVQLAGPTDMPIQVPGGTPNFVEGGGMPEQLAGPGTETYVKPPVDLPQTITPAARQTMIEQIAAKSGSVSSAIAMVNRLYTAVRGGRSSTTGTPTPVAYQRTGASAPENTGGLGTNVTPMLKQFAVPAVALIAALLSK
jgi:hypothetical protein